MTDLTRHCNRIPFFDHCTIELANGSHSAPLETLELGAGGFAFRSHSAIRSGSKITVYFNDHIREEGVVVCCFPEGNCDFHVDVSFNKTEALMV